MDMINIFLPKSSNSLLEKWFPKKSYYFTKKMFINCSMKIKMSYKV